MERHSQQETTFKLTDLTNRVPTDSAALKKKQNKKARAFLASFAAKPTSCLTVLPNENSASNSMAKHASDSLVFPKQQTATASAADTQLRCQRPPCFSRSLRKVNMEFFRGKRVVFKQSHVRISFEIVENIFD